MTPQHVAQFLKEAISKAVDNDLPNFGATIGERPIVFRIAHYLAVKVESDSSLSVDCDYNRHIDSQKLLPPKNEADDDTSSGLYRRFFPDIIVHSRRTDAHNLLVCEVKKADDHRGSDVDHERLKILTDQSGHFRYALGAFIEIDQAEISASVKFFKDGAVIDPP